MNICFYSCHDYELPYLKKYSNSKYRNTYLTEQLNLESCNLAEGNTIVSIFCKDDASSEVIERLSKMGVKLVALRSTGFNNIDLNTCKGLEMRVCHVPSYSPEAIAEHALTLILSLSRQIIKADRQVRVNNFSLSGMVGFNLGAKTVGVIGTGNIGSSFIKMLSGFGCKILAYDLYPKKELSKKYNVTYCSLNEIIKKSEILSLHLPFNDHTHYIINAKNINSMKEGIIIINTGRGQLVDTKALVNGLITKKIGGLGLDVYENETACYFEDHSEDDFFDPLLNKLLSFDNVIITAHQAFLTDTALSQIANTTFKNIQNHVVQNYNSNFLN